MIEIGRICIKIAGRDSNRRCVIVDIVDDNYVVVMGETRNKKVNVNHLEPTKKKISIKKGASKADVAKELKKEGIELKETKPKKAAARPKKVRKAGNKAVEAEKPKAKK